MSAHTPGPWIWGDDYHGLYGAGPDNEVLSYASYENCWLAYGDARVANACLIAAAPGLLGLLRIARCPQKGCDQNGTLADGSQCQWCDERKNAIAKAEGKS